MALSPKQQRFVEEYLLDLNATAAYQRAGYKATGNAAAVEGHRLLRNPKIVAAIAAKQAERSAETRVTQNYVLTNLVEVVERCMQRAPVMVRDGREMVQATDADGNHIWEFDSKGAIGALVPLGKHLGMFKEKVELTGADGKPLQVTVTLDDVQAARRKALEYRTERDGPGTDNGHET